jgi:hypothetical protein
MSKSKCPLVVAYGLGVDSTAMLVGMHQRGIRPDLILFADTGGEKPETYAFLPIMQKWLKKVGFPPVVVVKYKPERFKWEAYSTLEGNCVANATLPSLAFGFKSCSLKWKRAPQDKYTNGWGPAKECWARGGKVRKAIGYDAGPADTKRAWNLTSDEQYEYWYPLRDWGWDRDECKRQIAAAGLPVPMKSSCFFCPAMKRDEVEWLVREHPDYALRILRMESIAKPYLESTEGLWRSVPGGMTPFILEQMAKLVPAYKLVRKKRGK